jgi:hypothetical protein
MPGGTGVVIDDSSIRRSQSFATFGHAAGKIEEE